ncbi:hypothetical protein FBU30_003738 [Linnemannia zychae]|nr:hypothetical protein FBU30_003738 [Linnemannia zychae]
MTVFALTTTQINVGKLRNTYNGLCLDAPQGVNQGSLLNLASCDSVKHGNWLLLQTDNKFWIKNFEMQESNGGKGWCVDFWMGRTDQHPSLWGCNFSSSQLFLRDSNARSGTLSFMTSYRGNQSRPFHLTVLPDDSLGSLNYEDHDSNEGRGWCIDFRLDRTGAHPDLWGCLASKEQVFVRDSKTRPGVISFKTSYSVDQYGEYELSVLNTDGVGSLVTFFPSDLHPDDKCTRYEWIYS